MEQKTLEEVLAELNKALEELNKIIELINLDLKEIIRKFNI